MGIPRGDGNEHGRRGVGFFSLFAWIGKMYGKWKGEGAADDPSRLSSVPSNPSKFD